MSWDPIQRSAVSSSLTDINCTICLEKIVPENQTSREEEKPRVLNCIHIFHRECIGSWLVQQHSCPLCRTSVLVDTPQAHTSEMSPEEILAVPDYPPLIPIQEVHAGIFFVIRNRTTGNARRVIVNVNSSEAEIARIITPLLIVFNR
ncbi:MAG: hypothetical protein H0X29_00425 [Parachlamydiaceae bacterium]|nr:hypothetical protein [Parachlamydiaceae bacterium]